MSAGHNAGENAAGFLKKGFAKVHGAGEALRGNINSFADTATNTDASKNENIAARGVDEFTSGQYQGTGAGVTPKDTPREQANREVQGEHAGVGTSLAGGQTAGPHGSNLGNRMDPTVDSDLSSHPNAERRI